MVQRKIGRVVWCTVDMCCEQKMFVSLLMCGRSDIRYLRNVRDFYDLIVLRDVEYEICLGIHRSYGICNLCGR